MSDQTSMAAAAERRAVDQERYEASGVREQMRVEVEEPVVPNAATRARVEAIATENGVDPATVPSHSQHVARHKVLDVTGSRTQRFQMHGSKKGEFNSVESVIAHLEEEFLLREAKTPIGLGGLFLDTQHSFTKY